MLKARADRSGSYSALSYTWGSSELRQEIYINGHRLDIGPNLYRFCQQFQRSANNEGPQWTSWLWIDQICIARSNILERNHQSRADDVCLRIR